MFLRFFGFGDRSLAFVVPYKVTVLANALGINQLFRVFTISCMTFASIDVVAVITHALGVMLKVRVLASRDAPPYPLLRRLFDLGFWIKAIFG